MSTPQTQGTDLTRFVVRLGFVSLFADFAYEGSHAILGGFMATLKASPVLVGLIAGAGELLGAAVRLFSGHLTDRTRRYWPIMAAGYFANLLAVPALALARDLWVAVPLIWAERLGKGLRSPARNVVLAQAGEHLGVGRAFGLHTILDQCGALLGPLMVAGIVAGFGYHAAFASLLVPATASLVMLRYARALAPALKAQSADAPPAALPPIFYGYLIFAALTIMGLAHFMFFSYHLAMTHRLAPAWIPVLYALAMAVSGLTALGTGRLFDRIDLKVLYLLPLLLLIADPLQFLSQSPLALTAAAAVWGAALGVQDGALRAGITRLVPARRLGAAFGLFDMGLALAWMIGSLAMGALYRLRPSDLVRFGVATEVLALGVLTLLVLRTKKAKAA